MFLPIRRRLRRTKRIVVLIFILAFTTVCWLFIDFTQLAHFGEQSTSRIDQSSKLDLPSIISRRQSSTTDPDKQEPVREVEPRVVNSPDVPTQRLMAITGEHTQTSLAKPCEMVHAFYYPWYGNPMYDGKYLHWNHNLIPHWNSEVAKKFGTGRHEPPLDIGSDFYPVLGAYSSRDPAVVESHLKSMALAGIGVAVVSYYPPGKADNEGESWVDVFKLLFAKAKKYGIKITFHIEPYKGRNEMTVREDIKSIIDMYGQHPSLYRYRHQGQPSKPLIYVYDSYHTSPGQWSTLLDEAGPHTIRNTPYDCVMVCLVVEYSHIQYITEGKFDGFYTYFATNGFTFGSSWRNWKTLSDFAKQTGSLFMPSVGPGYIDTSIRPWNDENTRDRENGRYYSNAWLSALQIKPDIISVTSFNEWHEGTQIEPAMTKSGGNRNYLDYEPKGSFYYLEMTKKFVNKFLKCASHNV